LFDEIYKLIDNRKFEDAVTSLLPLYKDQDSKTAAYAGYLLGYINTCYDYKGKSVPQARSYLSENIHGPYPHPYAFVLYSRLEEDNNVALNHLNKGLERYPKNAAILEELLVKSPDKNEVIAIIEDSGLCDLELMGCAIKYLIRDNQWGCIRRFIFRIQSAAKLDIKERIFLDLLCAYAYIFQENPDDEKAQKILEEVIEKDIDNYLAYSHYLGLIYTLVRLGDTAKAIDYFDRLPVNNSIIDFDDMPWPFGIFIDFEEKYKTVFESILDLFEHDDFRKLKARVLYALYLHHPYEATGFCRYKKADAVALARYLKIKFNPRVAEALYSMRCHFKQVKEAYEVLWYFLRENQSLTDNWVFFNELLELVDEESLKVVARQTIIHLQEDDYSKPDFINEIFAPLVEKLHEYKMYSIVRNIAEFLSDEEIITSGCAFACAYAFGEENSERATILYEKLIEKEPNNASAMNNLGVRYRKNGDIYKALLYYEKASFLDPEKQLYKDNLRITKESIQNQIREDVDVISNKISLEALQAIGYNVDLCKRVHNIQDIELKDIIQRDLRECAIAVVAGQDKLATIMCGSIVEALLLYQIREKGVTKYDVSSVSHRKDASKCAVSDMALNELLYVAFELKILDRASHYLGHYLKDYRNMVHPVREIRAKEKATHENVVTMWAILVKLISDIFENRA